MATQWHKTLEPGQIRLKRLEPGSGDASLHCKLISCNIADQWVSYPALPYCWGDPAWSASVNCPEAISIPFSLHSALRRLRRVSLTTWIWADAVCINQSNEYEKNYQLLLIQEIYRQAGRVTIYLGEDAVKTLCWCNCSWSEGRFSAEGSSGY